MHRSEQIRITIAALLLAALAGGAKAEEGMGGMGKAETHAYLGLDRLEYQFRDGDNAALWDLQAWAGGDIQKAWIKAEGEWIDGEGVENSQLQALYSRAIAAFWDLQMGLRHDFSPNPSKTYAVFGVQGLAPYRFHIDAAGFLSEDGDFSTRIEAEYDLRITQRWILQPRGELDAAFGDVPELGIGSGFTTLEAGLRLRYEIRPEFAPYLGVEYQRLFGDTADFARLEGRDSSGWSAILGLRAWF